MAPRGRMTPQPTTGLDPPPSPRGGGGRDRWEAMSQELSTGILCTTELLSGCGDLSMILLEDCLSRGTLTGTTDNFHDRDPTKDLDGLDDDDNGSWTLDQNEKPPRPLTRDLSEMVSFIHLDQCDSIVLLSGAGMSRSSGIPDF